MRRVILCVCCILLLSACASTGAREHYRRVTGKDHPSAVMSEWHFALQLSPISKWMGFGEGQMFTATGGDDTFLYFFELRECQRGHKECQVVGSDSLANIKLYGSDAVYVTVLDWDTIYGVDHYILKVMRGNETKESIIIPKK